MSESSNSPNQKSTGWISRTVIVATLIGWNLFLYSAAMAFETPLWAVCGLSAIGAAIGVMFVMFYKSMDNEHLIGALAGSATAIFCFVGFQMTIFAHWLAYFIGS